MNSTSMSEGDAPLISIILTTYNSQRTIGKVLESIVNQNFPLDQVELIMVDGGSKDDTLKIIKEFGRKHSRKFWRFELIVHDRNYGVSKARNDGIKRSKGKYLLILDHDIVMKPGTLRTMFEYLKKAPNNVGVIIPLHKTIGDNLLLHKWYYLIRKGKISCINYITSCALVRRGLIEEIGYYDETLGPPFTIYEDLEYGARALSKGYRILELGWIEVLHDIREYDDVSYEQNKKLVKTTITNLSRILSGKYLYALRKYLRSAPFIEKIRWSLYVSIYLVVPICLTLSFLIPLLSIIPVILLLILWFDVLVKYWNSRQPFISILYSSVAFIWRLVRSIVLLVPLKYKNSFH